MSKDNGGPASDRELLEMAAKAAGMVGVWHERGQCIHVTDCAGMSDIWWRPLDDDGDALRLAVMCGLSVDRTSNRCWAAVAGKAVNGACEEFYGRDPYAATRRAIVRAAAAIWSAM